MNTSSQLPPSPYQMRNIRISKCLSQSQNSYTYLGTLLPDNQKLFIKSYQYSPELFDSTIQQLKLLHNLQSPVLFLNKSIEAHNDRIFTVYDQFISTLQSDVINRGKVKAYYTEPELRKAIKLLLEVTLLLNKHHELGLKVKDIRFDQIKIFANFVLKIDLRAEEPNLRKDLTNNLNDKEQSASHSSNVPLRLISKVLFLDSKRKFNSMNHAKLKAYFQGKRSALARFYSSSFLEELEDLIVKEKAETFNSHGSSQVFPWKNSLPHTLKKWYFLSEAEEVQYAELQKIYSSARSIAEYHYETSIEDLEVGPYSPKGCKYKIFSKANWLNKITTLTGPSKGPVSGLSYLLRDGNFESLHTLDLSECLIGDKGLRIIALYSNLYNLENISLLGTKITEKGVYYFAQGPAFGNLKCLSALGSGFGGDMGIKNLSESRYLTRLEDLNLYDNKSVTSKGIQYLAKGRLNGLKELILEGSSIGDCAFAALSHSRVFEGLKLLNLSKTNITHKGLEEYARSEYLKNIEILYLNECHIGDQGVEYLKDSENTKSIQYLHLVNCGFTGNALVTLKSHETFKNLKGHRWGSVVSDTQGKVYSVM